MLRRERQRPAAGGNWRRLLSWPRANSGRNAPIKRLYPHFGPALLLQFSPYGLGAGGSSSPFRVHSDVPLPVPAINHGVGAVARDPEDDRDSHRR